VFWTAHRLEPIREYTIGFGSFNSTCWPASSELSGRWAFGHRFAFTPNLGFTYFQDYAAA